MHYKLDRGIDHVLIDEAQDTSPKQWEIVAALVGRIHRPAARAPNVRRTMFAVGDEKQSIFSFQGAAPREFDEMRRAFRARSSTRPSCDWRYLRFDHSFRSGANVLGAVDEVFSAREVFASVTTDEAGVPPHSAAGRRARPGRNLAADRAGRASARSKAGTRRSTPRARQARGCGWRATDRQAREAMDGATGARPGDVLVLVRQRGPLFEAIIRALKNAEHPGRRRRPAGADRAHRGDGPDGAGRRAAAAGRRSRARDRAEEPAVRL